MGYRINLPKPSADLDMPFADYQPWTLAFTQRPEGTADLAVTKTNADEVEKAHAVAAEEGEAEPVDESNTCSPALGSTNCHKGS